MQELRLGGLKHWKKGLCFPSLSHLQGLHEIKCRHRQGTPVTVETDGVLLSNPDGWRVK